MSKTLRPLFRPTEIDDYLKAAIKTADFINQYIVEVDEETLYFKEVNENKIEVDLGIYSGNAGIIIFYLELYKATLDKQYLETAKKAGNYLIKTLKARDLYEETLGLLGLEYPKAQWNFTSGYTGIAFVLAEIHKQTHEDKYLQAVETITNELLKAAEETTEGIIWTGESGMLADGGILLYLIHISKVYNNDKWHEAALKAGYHIKSTVKIVDEDKVKFDPFNQKYLAELNGLDPNIAYEWPNWEYGTPGTAYIMAKLYQETQDETFLDLAIKGANYVSSIADPIGENGQLVPYRLPDLSDLYFMSYCHGPVGDSRVYELLYEITRDDKYRKEVEKFANGILNTNAPNVHSEGYWHFYGQCCGTAGMIEFFIDLNKEWPDDKFSKLTYEAGEKILSEGVLDTDGAKWPQAFWRVDPSHITIDLGYFDGAAGIAVSLIHIYQAAKGNYDFINFPGKPSFQTKNN